MNSNILKNQLSFMQFSGQAFAYGNTKIPRSTLIVNLTSAENCPSKKRELCQVVGCCYALKCERIYSNYKHKNLVMQHWLNTASTEDIITLMSAYIYYAPETINLIRLDEAGDFTCQNQIRQWNKIAKFFWESRGIRTYTYTARTDLDFSEAPYIMVNGSLPGIPGAVRVYKCIPPQIFDNIQLNKGEYKCPGDCHKCNVCSSINFRGTIYSRQH